LLDRGQCNGRSDNAGGLKRDGGRHDDPLEERFARLGLQIHPAKTRIVYSKDANRHGSHEHERFDFLG